MKYLAAIVALPLIVTLSLAQDKKPDDSMKSCPMHAQHMASHEATVESHGDRAMGFPHDKTSHHFRIAADGGVIEVNANDAADNANADAIRMHLSHIVTMFANGDFSAPMLVHDSIPPGVTTMKLMKSAIRYTYYKTSAGGMVRLQSADPIAVAAIHDFLRFQITEHQTGDSLDLADSSAGISIR
jgi:hypothetical protein